jgi:hypothetical protein
MRGRLVACCHNWPAWITGDGASDKIASDVWWESGAGSNQNPNPIPREDERIRTQWEAESIPRAERPSTNRGRIAARMITTSPVKHSGRWRVNERKVEKMKVRKRKRGSAEHEMREVRLNRPTEGPQPLCPACSDVYEDPSVKTGQSINLQRVVARSCSNCENIDMFKCDYRWIFNLPHYGSSSNRRCGVSWRECRVLSSDFFFLEM